MTIEGGQFLSIQSNYDKGRATRWLRSHNGNSDALIIALGDGPNDQTMLSEADIAVVIKSPKSYLLKVATFNKYDLGDLITTAISASDSIV